MVSQLPFDNYLYKKSIEFSDRLLDASFGVWIQRDPLGLTVGINLYEYVHGKPLGLLDPFGFEVLTIGSITLCFLTGVCEALVVALLVTIAVILAAIIVAAGINAFVEWVRAREQEAVRVRSRERCRSDDTWGTVCCICGRSGGSTLRYDTICNLPTTVPMFECCDTICPAGWQFESSHQGPCFSDDRSLR